MTLVLSESEKPYSVKFNIVPKEKKVKKEKVKKVQKVEKEIASSSKVDRSPGFFKKMFRRKSV